MKITSKLVYDPSILLYIHGTSNFKWISWKCYNARFTQYP